MNNAACVLGQSEVMKFANTDSSPTVPFWLALTYLTSNLILHSLNFYWFGRMIETVRKRFDGQEHDEYKNEREGTGRDRRQSLVEELASELDENEISGPRTPYVEKTLAEVEAKGATGVEAVRDELNKRRGVKHEVE